MCTKQKVVSTQVTPISATQSITRVVEDYVPADHLDTYVANQKSGGFFVDVIEGHDAGPGGCDGETFTDHLYPEAVA